MKLKILSLCLWSSSCLALQTYPLIDQQRTDVIISRDSHTRIAVHDDRIQQIFGAEGLFEIQSDDEQGQIFLRPIHSGFDKPISITIITENGLTQDIKLTGKKIESQSILFKPTLAKVEKSVPQAHKTEDLVQFMEYMKNARDGVEVKIDRPFPDKLKVISHQLIEHAKFSGHVYEVVNVSKKPLFLSEPKLSEKRDLALSIGSKKLFPKQSTKIYIIRRINP